MGSWSSRRYGPLSGPRAEISSCVWWLIVPRRELVEVAQEAGADMVGTTNLKAALDRDWDKVGQREEALGLVLNGLQALETWVQTRQQEEAILAQPFLKIAKPGERARWTHR